LTNQLIALACDDTAVHGVRALAADAVAGAHDVRRTRGLHRGRAEGRRQGAGGLLRERREPGAPKYAVPRFRRSSARSCTVTCQTPSRPLHGRTSTAQVLAAVSTDTSVPRSLKSFSSTGWTSATVNGRLTTTGSA
jgi:hypothetical protein